MRNSKLVTLLGLIVVIIAGVFLWDVKVSKTSYSTDTSPKHETKIKETTITGLEDGHQPWRKACPGYPAPFDDRLSPVLSYYKRTENAPTTVQINFDWSVATYFDIYRMTEIGGPVKKVVSNFPSNAHTAIDTPPADARLLYYCIVALDKENGQSVSRSLMQVTGPSLGI